MPRIVRPWILALAAIGLAHPVDGQAPTPAPAPAWFLQHIAEMTADGGVWITDNARYRSDGEPSDAYGLHWQMGLGHQHMMGRLFGLRDGKEIGTFWQFRAYWHPGQREVILSQIGGDGTLGEGRIWSVDSERTESDQTFWTPSGTDSRNRHLSKTVGDTHTTESFDWVEGGWVARRIYTWIRKR